MRSAAVTPQGAGSRVRAAVKGLAGASMLAVLATGVWGVLVLVGVQREIRTADDLQSAYQALRYQAVVQRSALRDALDHPAEAKTAYFASASAATAAAGRIVALAPAGDSRGASAGRTESAVMADAAKLFKALGAHRRGDARAIERRLEQRLAAFSASSGRAANDARLRRAGSWPTGLTGLVPLAALALVFLSGVVGVLVALARAVGLRRKKADQRDLELRRLENAALTDHMTRLRNHRAFHEDLKREIGRRNRTSVGFCLLMIDLNGLKKVNDTKGHQAGDEQILSVARCLTATVRAGEMAYRVGGDEFTVLLPGARAFSALNLAERIHGETQKWGHDLRVTIGIAESTATEAGSTLIRQADLALYEAKRSRLGTMIYTPGLDPQGVIERESDERHHQKLLATALARAVDAKDAGTRNHCETVAELCALVGTELGLDDERVQRLRLAGLLHDVGKIGIADAILQKPEPLAEEEEQVMVTHSVIGHGIVSATELEEEADWVLHHHERFDGTGYPHGLVGEEIPLESRIILVADAFEAITADRPYRGSRTPEEALRELAANAGSQFDPTCVQALCAVFGQPYTGAQDELAERRAARGAAA